MDLAKVNRKGFGKDSLRRPLRFVGGGWAGQWWSCILLSIKTEACMSHGESKHQLEGVREWLRGSGLAEEL